ncbi:hypothetical protein KR100_06370 [Synechococcus sp. KORDI-100]|nr:hypothetical protein KR100_06370 [Synechococcus sp. KORDI-100]
MAREQAQYFESVINIDMFQMYMTTPWRLNKFIIYYTFIVDRMCF